MVTLPHKALCHLTPLPAACRLREQKPGELRPRLTTSVYLSRLSSPDSNLAPIRDEPTERPE